MTIQFPAHRVNREQIQVEAVILPFPILACEHPRKREELAALAVLAKWQKHAHQCNKAAFT